MKKVQHLHEDRIYYISNHSVARNPMFAEYGMQKFFIEKMEKYLGPLCEIIAHNLKNNEFQLLVKLKDRESFISYFQKQAEGSETELNEVPESTYIFSQAMANLQVSYVKHFNYKYKRSGTLMAGRFIRMLVETEEEMMDLIESLNKGEVFHQYHSVWVNDIMNGVKAMTSNWIYKGNEKVEEAIFGCYLNAKKIDLGDAFKNLDSLKDFSSKRYFLLQFNRLFGPSHTYKL